MRALPRGYPRAKPRSSATVARWPSAGIALLALASLSVQALAQPVTSADGLRAELIRLENERQQAYVAGDRGLLERHFAAEYVHTNLRGQTTDRAAELDFYAPGRFTLSAGAIDEVAVQDHGDVAVLLGVVTWRDAMYRPGPGTSIDLSGRFRVTRVYVRRDGRWQVSASHASRIGG